ncbi:MAG: glycoside hydrolase family 130 protein [Planctomycetes bacterium]|nr:glycoside hydrolase family 130 protein [Planctomycetota bacterium]
MLVKRFDANPLITPTDVCPSRPDYEVVGAFNPGATVYNGETLLLLRVAERPKDKADNEEVAPILDPRTGQLTHFRVAHNQYDLEVPDSRSFIYRGRMYLTSISHLRIARSTDGVHFKIDERPAVFPETEYETFGLEDPRISRIGDEYYITYKVVSRHGICTGLLKTRDFKRFDRQGIIFCPENIDVVLFPEKINGKYYALTRPVPKHIGPFAIWLASSEDAIRWGNHIPLITPREGDFDGGKVGGSCVPIRTDEGWLEIYHGADAEDRYSLAAALLDINDPARVIARAKVPLMQPAAEYETHGFYGNVVFSCGATADAKGKVTIYYGASDEYTAGATTTIEKIMSTMK